MEDRIRILHNELKEAQQDQKRLNQVVQEKELALNVVLQEIASKGVLEESLKIDNSKKLVSLMHVNNEIGNILNLHEVGNLCHNNKLK